MADVVQMHMRRLCYDAHRTHASHMSIGHERACNAMSMFI